MFYFSPQVPALSVALTGEFVLVRVRVSVRVCVCRVPFIFGACLDQPRLCDDTQHDICESSGMINQQCFLYRRLVRSIFSKFLLTVKLCTVYVFILDIFIIYNNVYYIYN